ncbi:MAG: glycosyltransferase [Cyanobacteriota bacterium]|nr:glycosyltransferase [Cyanobacteriota bacterium]
MKIVPKNLENYKTDVSIIVPTHNRIVMLEEALTSVRSQTFEGEIEIIVIDDNSQDGTSEKICQEYPEVRLIRLEQNQGAYVARNRAILEAKGKYIAFLDSDDLWEPEYLQSQIETLEDRESHFCASAVSVWYVDEDRKLTCPQKPDLVRFTSPLHQLLVKSNFIFSPSSVVFLREVFEEIGLFDETFRIGADREFYARCIIFGYPPIFTEKPLAILRKHSQGQLTDLDASKIELRKQSRIAYLEKLYPSIVERQLKAVPIRRLYAEIYSTAARQFFKEKHFYSWLVSWFKTLKYASVKYVVLNMGRDVIRSFKKYSPTKILKTVQNLRSNPLVGIKVK